MNRVSLSVKGALGISIRIYGDNKNDGSSLGLSEAELRKCN
jgi:hypothetical protein